MDILVKRRESMYQRMVYQPAWRDVNQLVSLFKGALEPLTLAIGTSTSRLISRACLPRP